MRDIPKTSLDALNDEAETMRLSKKDSFLKE
jgi:hypothetical protein